MKTLCIILARAGSKGLPNKNIQNLAGRPTIAWTIDHARAAARLNRIVVSTDGPAIARVAADYGIAVVGRPPELASDTATVDSAARHALLETEKQFNEKYDAVVLLYGNVPLRPLDLIDRALNKLATAGCDSVQSVAPVEKNHPYWMKKLSGPTGDVLEHYQPNHIYRRQDLPPVYMLDGGIIAVTRASLMTEKPGEPHAFLGTDRRAVLNLPGSVVDIDTPHDFHIAEAMLRPPVGATTQITIRRRPIAEKIPAYIIAELGVNHDGSLKRALELTRHAAAAGADAVKLQLFDARLLLSAEAEFAAYQEGAAADPFQMLNALQLSTADMLKVRSLADELDLAFIVTCFSVELLDVMRQLDPDAVKIASPDSVNLPLIDAMASLRKPMLVSLGTTRSTDDLALGQMMRICGGADLALLHCVSAYPVPAGFSGLRRITELRARCSVPIGYSDHTTDLDSGMLAVALGALIVEKHLTYDTAAAGPDHAASLDPAQFAEYTRRITAIEQELKDGDARDDIEADVRRVSRQSVCAVCDLPAGHVIRREDVTVKRPGTGIPAARLDVVVGKSTRRAVKANHLLHENDVQI